MTSSNPDAVEDAASPDAVDRMTMDYPAADVGPELPLVQNLEGPVPAGTPVTAAAGYLDGVDSYDPGSYSTEFGNIVNEASVPGADLSVCVFDSGEAHISSVDDRGSRQPVSGNLDPDEMREIADDLRDLLSFEPPEQPDEGDDGAEYGRVFTAGDLTFAVDGSGDVSVSRSSDGLRMFDLPPEQVDDLADALETSAQVWEREFLEADAADQVVVAAVGVSRKGLKSDRALRRYWVTDRDHKIMWGVPGDFKRCTRHLRKYVRNPEGLCAEYHHERLGVWPGREHGGKHPIKASASSAVLFRLGSPAVFSPTGSADGPLHQTSLEGNLGLVVSLTAGVDVTARGGAASHVLCVGDRLKVVGANAVPYAALVVDLKSLGDRAEGLLICDAVRESGGATSSGQGDGEDAISLRVRVPGPSPAVVASGSFAGVSFEPLGEGWSTFAQGFELDATSVLVPMSRAESLGHAGFGASSERTVHEHHATTWRYYNAQDWRAAPIVAGGGELTMHIVENSTGCSGRVAVVDGAGGIQGCYDDVQTALAAAGAMPSTPVRVPVAGRPEMWHAVVHREGVSTGKRTWLPGSVSWRPTPFAFHQEVVSGAHGSAPVTVYVGNVTRIGRDGNAIHAWGDIDLDSPQGLEFARRLADGFGGWPSFGPGSESMTYDVITDPGKGASEPDQIIFSKYRIGEFTSVSVPGQEGTFIEPTAALMSALDARRSVEVVTAGAVRSHSTDTSDVAWDADTQTGKLPTPMPVSTARAMYAWVDDSREDQGEIVKDAAKFPHHLVSGDGQPGAADVSACSAGIAALHGARGNRPDIPAGDRAGVYNHLRQHLIDAGRDPKTIPALNAAIVTAAGAWQLAIPEVPPRAWFEQPAAFPHGFAVTMSDAGEIVGLLAPRDVAHRTYARNGQRKTLRDIGRVDYGRWLKETVAAGETGVERVLAGPLVMECMHAPQSGYGTLDRRNQYYEDSCAVFARVAIGEIEEGTWIHGAAMPGISTEQAIKFLSCDVSGDWQPHPERPGWMEFVAVLAVPVGGFPKDKRRVSTTVLENADELVVAGGSVPVQFAPVVVPVDPDIIDALAAEMGLDVSSRIETTAREIAALMGETDEFHG